MKYHHIVHILSSKMKSEITDNHIDFANMLKCYFGKTNEVVKIIDIIRDHSNNIINNIDSMYKIMENRKSKKGYIMFPKKEMINKAISFFKNNIEIIKELAIQAGWYTKLFTKKAVICLTTGQKFKSMKEAAHILGCSASGISKCCRGIQKTTYKMKFRYDYCS
jgi:hypothetical protein